MTPCSGRDADSLGRAKARIDERLVELLNDTGIDTFIVSVTLTEPVAAEQLAEWGLVQAPEELIGALPRELVLALAERDEVDCIRAAREMRMAVADASPEDVLNSSKLDAGLAGALAVNPEGPHKVIVSFTAAVDTDWLEAMGLAQTGRLPKGGLLASGFVDRRGLEELIRHKDAQSIGSVQQRRLRRPKR